MITEIETTVRPAKSSDRQRLASLIHFEQHVHRHLDWRNALDWLGYHPYLVVERRDQLVAALSCPPDPPRVSWIRLFASADTVGATYAWRMLWPAALEQLSSMECTHIAAIPMQPWFRKILDQAHFTHSHDVVLLAWEGNPIQPAGIPPESVIREMRVGDLPAVQEVDAAAFSLLWQNSLTALELAYHQAFVATVAEDDQGVFGYQISTQNALGGHLARLAVHPRGQRKGIGYTLLHDLLVKCQQQGIRRVTVNTQDDNYASLALYKKAGFQETGQEFPIYQATLS